MNKLKLNTLSAIQGFEFQSWDCCQYFVRLYGCSGIQARRVLGIIFWKRISDAFEERYIGFLGTRLVMGYRKFLKAKRKEILRVLDFIVLDDAKAGRGLKHLLRDVIFGYI